MWGAIFLFELRYWLRGWMVWIFLLVISLLVFGAASTDYVHIGGVADNTLKNAPFVIENYYSILAILSLLTATVFVSSAAARDFASRTDQMLFSRPIRKSDFLLGRYAGSAVVSAIPLLGVSLGVLTGKYMPWVDAERWGAVNWNAHLWGVLAFALPNTLLIAAVVFAIAAWSRNAVVSFLGVLLLLTGYSVASDLMGDLKTETMSALMDPFGVGPFRLMTKYWNVAERNQMTLGLTGTLLWNRLVWLGVAAAFFALACWRFSFEARAPRQKPKLVEEDNAVPVVWPARAVAPSCGGVWPKLLFSLRTEFFQLVKSASFVVILAAALLNTVPGILMNAKEGFGNRSFPVTYQIVNIAGGRLLLFSMALITWFAGVLVWRDRDTRVDELHDHLPVPDWVPYVAKFTALAAALFLIQGLVIGTGVLLQAVDGYTRFQLGLYATEMWIMAFSWWLFLAVLAFLFHVVSPNKYVGYFGYVLFLFVNAVAWKPLGVATRLVQFGSRPEYTYSDFYGYGPYLEGWIWFTLYWAAFCGLLAVASILLWRRGKESSWRHRLHMAGLRFAGPLKPAAAVLGAAFLATGVWIFYNTKVLNTLRSEQEDQQLAADYEKNYKRFEEIPQPRITEVKFRIDLYPESRNAALEVDQEILNKTEQPLAVMYLTMPKGLDCQVAIAGATLDKDDSRLLYRIYRLTPAMAPGESRRMRIAVKSRTRGFENSVTMPHLAQNGTFFNNDDVLPQIGYQRRRELGKESERKAFGLSERDRMPALEPNCTEHCTNSYLSNNSDWVTVESVVSTSADQIAIAPGSLLAEWQAGGRRYFHYKLDHPSINFYSILSARYQVLREERDGRKIEIYHLKEHPWNVERMRQAVYRSLEYYSANFGPYRHRQARIIEFPRVASFAQAFPGTMPYSEGIGFIADLRNPEDVDHVFWVVSHEMAHQWWAYQVIGANMQGATLLSETLSQYSSMMVLEREYGRDMMCKFLKYSMDGYLRARGRESLKEQPLLKVEASQSYIHYDKGAVALYYLKEMIGEEAVNRALRKVIARYAYADPPYPTAWALVHALREQTPANLQYLITDLFEDITLFLNRTLTAEATQRPDGSYDVAIEVESRKFKADEKGNEREVKVDDWIDIGAFAAPPKGRKYGKTLHRDRVHVTSPHATYRFVVAEKPAEAGIDPFQLLIDRVPEDNAKSITLAHQRPGTKQRY